VLDGWGGLHAFGGAPDVTVSGYWSNWDIARGVVFGKGGGFVVDGWGGVHPFWTSGSASVASPPISASWAGQDLTKGIG
jgi:hypothetical protein